MKKAKVVDLELVTEPSPKQQKKQEFDFEVETAEQFKIVFANVRNPIELMMATKLFVAEIPFIYQSKIEIDGISFGRKYIVADFVLLNCPVIIETDGKQHKDDPKQVAKDISRNNFLAAKGFVVFQFDWDAVMSNREDFDIMSFVKDAIDNY